ncbi:TonB-dependent receptor domain-containing protein [Terrimonas pollutisoli]|uniref:TonB-dependent receptor domain-containing protein n=1 Tax=Terrimonas pollutisoli TaxID=3034147 RepID=UPI0023EDA826|nr:TonB-dependent receptor [Terrimonas sp. H1YJ31]
MKNYPFLNIPLYIFMFISLFISSGLYSQLLQGKVTSSNGESLSNANVLLLNSRDSSLLKGAVSGKAGNYKFQNIRPGTYLLSASMSGYQTAYSRAPVIVGENEIAVTIPVLNLSENVKQLGEVKVMATRPFIVQEIDRTVVNVANSIVSAGNTALEVLERSPGIMVDRQNNVISMLGKDGVNVMINGKLNYMPASSVIQMLEGMNAANIDKIELITTPPANFDAQGNAGYINIVLKQNDNFGTNGSVSGTIGYGKGWMGQASLNMNHRKGKTNVFGNISLSRTKKPTPFNGYSRVSNNGNITENYFNTDRVDTTWNYNARLGLDYQASSRTLLGLLITSGGRLFRQGERRNNPTYLNSQPDTLRTSSNSEINNLLNYGANLNLQHTFKDGQDLKVNADYIHYINDQPVNYYTQFYDKAGAFIYDSTARSKKKTPIDFWVAGADYSRKLSKKISMDAGIKGTIASFNNDISYERLVQNNWERDPFYSAVYTLKENYSAAYISFNMTASEKISIKTGLRYEYTNSNLGTRDTKNIVDRHYGNLFPSFFLSHKVNDNNTFTVSYNARIDRPKINQLAPFTYFTSSNSVLTGNPALQPAISNKVSLGYSLRKYFFSVAFAKEDHAIAEFQPTVDSVTNKTIVTAENLKNKKLVSAVVSIPVSVSKWWSMFYNITGLWEQVNAIYKNEPVHLENKNINIYMSQRFNLPKDFSIELSGFYLSRSLRGIAMNRAMGKLDFGLRKKMSEKDAINFSVDDVFNIFEFRSYADIPEHNLVGHIRFKFAQRTFKITYSRNFGNIKLKQNRNITTGAEEEKKRVE